MLKLIIEDDEGRKTVIPFVREEITIGRQEGNTIRLTERNVSRRHARLVRHNGSVLVEDLGSYNGIRINGERISGQVAVRDGDLIQIGDYDLALERELVEAPPLPASKRKDRTEETTHPELAATENPDVPWSDTSPDLRAIPDNAAATLVDDDEVEEAPEEDVQSVGELARRVPTAIIHRNQLEGREAQEPPPPAGEPTPIDAAQAPRLVVISSELEGREFACIRTQLLIGRTEDNDISLDHRSLSRTHARVQREENGQWRVIDLASANGLTVNGEAYSQSLLQFGDVLGLGHVKLKFLGPGQKYTAPSASGTRGRARSKIPLVISIMGVVALAGATSAWYLGRTSAMTAAPVSTPEPVPASEAPGETPEPEKAPDIPTVARSSDEEKLSAAKTAIHQREWDKAKDILEGCVSAEGTVLPAAQVLLQQMEAEAEFKRNIDKAEKALEQGKLAEAKKLLDGSAKTELLAVLHLELVARWEDAQPPKRPNKPAPPHPPESKAALTPAEDAQRVYEEGFLLYKNQQLKEARARWEKCLRVDPTFALCHKALGGINAKLNESEKGLYHYKQFLKLAPNDKDAERVQAIVDQYEATR